jgi:hypothetical protein
MQPELILNIGVIVCASAAAAAIAVFAALRARKLRLYRLLDAEYGKRVR